MRKGPLLTNRDLLILLFISWGPAGDIDIFWKFFQKRDGNRKTRMRVMQNRLKKMEQIGTIFSTYSPRLKNTIYFLTPIGAQFVSDKFGRELSHIWAHRSKKDDIYHDALTAWFTRMTLTEAENSKGLFKIDSIVYERHLKTLQQGKGVCYPDFQLSILTGNERPIFDVEVDCGTIGRKDFLAKYMSFQNTMLVATNTEARMNLLLGYLRDIKCSDTVYLNRVANIREDGFLMGKWLHVAENRWDYLHPRLNQDGGNEG